MEERIALVGLGKPGAGKGTIMPAFLKMYPPDNSIVLSSGEIMASLPEAQPYYASQQPVPAEIYYPAMRAAMIDRIKVWHTLVVFDGVFRSAKDVLELWSKDLAKHFSLKLVIEILHDDHSELVDRMQKRGRPDFTTNGAYDRIYNYLTHRDAVMLKLMRQGLVYGMVDGTPSVEIVTAEFFNMFAQLRGGHAKVVGA